MSRAKNQLLVMRHGEAIAGFPDSARPLSANGEYEARIMADWLARRIQQGELACPALYASPFVRAQQTAQFISTALDCPLNTLEFITPDDTPVISIDWLLVQDPGKTLMLVSHMPLVGTLAGMLVGGASGQPLNFSTAAIAELESDLWATGCANLVRYTQPSQLG